MAMKNVGLRIRVERSLREGFIKACRAEDKSAAQVIREFMRGYIERASQEAAESRIEEHIKRRGLRADEFKTKQSS